jgi:hypothetical protein
MERLMPKATFGEPTWFRIGRWDLDQFNRYWLVKIGRLAIFWERK